MDLTAISGSNDIKFNYRNGYIAVQLRKVLDANFLCLISLDNVVEISVFATLTTQKQVRHKVILCMTDKTFSRKEKNI